jgi:hypothetical protein
MLQIMPSPPLLGKTPIQAGTLAVDLSGVTKILLFNVRQGSITKSKTNRLKESTATNNNFSLSRKQPLEV